MGSQPSTSEVLSFARWFCNDRLETFSKDMKICMTPDENKRHAYMPAVMACASFIELFSGLHAGKLNQVGLKNIVKFSRSYLDTTEFSEERVYLFFEMFRHKVAHVSRPYSVFYTHSVGTKSPLRNYPARTITWRITASFNSPAIEIISKAGSINKSRRPPWKTASYSHLCKINLKRMNRVLINSINGQNGYFESLTKDEELRRKFVKCMDSFYT